MTVSTSENQDSMLQHLWASIATTVILLVICCGIYPLIVWGLAQAIFPNQANGSLVKKDGTYTTKDSDAVGSALLGQNFSAAEYFHPRPSSAGAGYDAANSGGSNLGPLSDKLMQTVAQRVAAYRMENALAETALVPADAVTASASGLDPHISPANAAIQKARIARARGISEAEIQKLIDQHTDGPDLKILGDAGVNVLMLNLALDREHPRSK
jgi:K+-transporting ATPase ATPase C chain